MLRDVGIITKNSGPAQVLHRWATRRAEILEEENLAPRLRNAAEAIIASGLPTQAIADAQLRTIVEHLTGEDDDELAERWTALLANAGTQGSAEVRRAYPEILAQLEPIEAAALDSIVDHNGLIGGVRIAQPEDFDNLERLNLIRIQSWAEDDTPLRTRHPFSARPTDLGRAFVVACRRPPVARPQPA